MKKKDLLSVLLFVIAVVMMFIFLAGCSRTKGDSGLDANSNFSWEDFKMLPLAGYVVGYENEVVLLQMPVFAQGDAPFEQIKSVDLIGVDGSKLECSRVRTKDLDDRIEGLDVSVAILSFDVALPAVGKAFVADKMVFLLQDGSAFERDLGVVHFEALEKSEQSIAMRKFWINQRTANQMVIGFSNTSDRDVVIERLVFPRDMFLCKMQGKYFDFECMNGEKGNHIPMRETRFFCFLLERNPGFTDECLWLMPIVEYSVDGKTYQMPAQTQPTVVHSTLSKLYMEQLWFP